MSEKPDGKRRRAAALKYDPERDGAPVLTAFAEGAAARRLVERAESLGVPVFPDEPLVAVLSRLDVGGEIPPELYEAVAGILLFIADMDKTYAEKFKK
ncbi:MAG: EscU/YscU/HrcU family type III secretion system export apparatus switch protein [Oscillospiraceae bacterium]|jgi:flagellar biosynthesis protein|nr:EscU/YscU/HrcU family type III secretion system export apparatus switch protein [Oscillospiraceae bacterium]